MVAATTSVMVIAIGWVALWAANVHALNAVDDVLRSRAADLVLTGRQRPTVSFTERGRFRPDDVLMQVTDANFKHFYVTKEQLPFGRLDREVAEGKRKHTTYSTWSDGVNLRVYTVPVAVVVRPDVRGRGRGRDRVTSIPAALTDDKPDFTVTVAKPLDELNQSNAELRNTMVLFGGIGIVGAGLAGFLVAGSAIKPVRRLTETASRVAATRDVEVSIEPEGPAEVAELATSFNAMLDALASARAQQHQLVADASHELRTPITSLRTNIELLLRSAATAQPANSEPANSPSASSEPPSAQPATAQLDDAERAELLSDVASELGQLTTLVDEMVALATDEHDFGPAQQVDLADLVAEVVRRHRRLTDVTIVADLASSQVEVVPLLAQRAVSNLVDNAVKWTPDDGTVTVTVADGSVTVIDTGPGIAPPDLPHIFDRFYRADDARSMPGSGLGLSIVARVAEMFDGTAEVLRSDPSGTAIRLSFPPPTPDDLNAGDRTAPDA